MTEMESDEYVEGVSRTIKKEKEKGLDPFLRLGTVMILGSSRNPKAIQPLVELLKDEDRDIREDAADSLGEYGEEAVPHLVQALKDEDWKVQWGAAEALSVIGEPAKTPLIQLLHDEDWKVQWGAAEALRKMVNPPSAHLLPKEWKGVISDRSGKMLVQFLDSEWETRWRAMVTLGDLQDTRAVKHLSDALHHTDENVRARAARTLGKIRDIEAVNPLIDALKDKCKYVRINAAYSLGDIKDERAITPLIQLFWCEDKYPTYSSDAASFALSKIGKPAVIPLIETLKKEGEPHLVYYYASETLGNIGRPAAGKLIEALKDPHWKSRWGAIALGKTGDKRAVEPLTDALKDEDREVRISAAQVLGELQDKRAIEPLVERLTDEDDQVSGRAAIALQNMGKDALQPLVKAFTHSQGRVRSCIVWDLGAVGDSTVLDLLVEALQDPCWKVREKAVQSLGDILVREMKSGHGPVSKDISRIKDSVINLLGRALEDSHEDVRNQAERTLRKLKSHFNATESNAT